MIDVTVVILDGTFSSTAVGPMEVFRHTGMLWNDFAGKAPAPRFRVTTASANGRPVECDGPLYIRPMASLAAIRKADLIFLPSTGPSLNDIVERNGEVVPWLRRWSKREAAIASVCTGVGLVAATGLLDGKRATTHWGVAPEFRRQFPKVKWMPEVMVTEDRGFYCGGGVNASLDLSLYLVERYCGHEVAMQTAKALLIETPRAWQAGFGIVPLKTEHSDEAISGAQEWLHKNFQKNFALEAPARADAFFRLWTGKEAFLKATGEGLSRSTRSFEIDLRDDAARLLWARGVAAERYSVHPLEVGDPYRAALVVEAPRVSLRRFRWA